MLSWVYRHKGKFLVLGAAVAGSYVGGRWLLNKTSELQEKRRSSELEEARLQKHCENHCKTCLSAVVCLLPRLKEAVQAQLDAESITEQLRSKSAGKVPLWENLKIVCFARVIVGVYLCCALSAFLRIQLSILGGELSLLHRDQACDEGSLAQQQYLRSAQHLMREGLEALVGRVRKAAETVLLSYSLKHQLTAEGVGQLLSDIHSLSSSHRPTNSSKGVCQTSFLVQFLLPRDQSFQSPEETSGAAYSARDIIESAEFSMVLERCVNQTFSLMCCQISDIHHSAAQSETTLPVARVIPLISDMFDFIFSSHHDSLTQRVLATPELQKLSRNIFEAFSRPSE
ncbi:Peroxisomal biogenesis factor 3 [Geodia barretti]|uniref:Peroxisomal biogenesis factor 3 n=1 Tax=Geodia barretti TaxID=519541 RepID=A0AA35SJ11_GEOBA|nr:Peroxisomal biogenesis factor 3 [Geodia barretti]